MQVKGLCVSEGLSNLMPNYVVSLVKVSPFFWELDESHVAEAEVDQVLQQLLPDLVLNGLTRIKMHIIHKNYFHRI